MNKTFMALIAGIILAHIPYVLARILSSAIAVLNKKLEQLAFLNTVQSEKARLRLVVNNEQQSPA